VQARQGNYLAAHSLYEDILTLAMKGDDTRHIHVAYRVEQSRDRIGGSSEDDDQPNILLYVEGLAEVVAAQGEGAWAARLWGAAEAIREEIQAPWPAVFRMEYERAIAAARTQVGEKPFTAAGAEGRAMTLEQALAGLQQASLFESIPEALHAPQPPAPTDLTAREMEVLRLLARGLSNAQIAEELVVSQLTVKAHLRSIYSKLGVTSRSAATRYALEHHLS
jgi:DNA-binding CsgD family transcriptional regulator